MLYLTNERAQEVLTTQHVAGTPNIVIEIGSPGTRKRDETIKRRLYERSGVDEYWVVDPDLDVVRVYRRDGKRFAGPLELSREAGAVLSTNLFPELDLPLGPIFTD